MRNSRCIPLYKFRSLSGQYGREAIERAVTRNELWWQTPAEFNDPFDCIPVLYFGDSNADRLAFLKRAAAHAYPDLIRADRRRNQLGMQKMPPAEMENRLRQAWPGWINDCAITCFSEECDHPLMWGHYADSHKGVCLMFEEIATEQTQWFCFPVSYQDARPRVNLTRFNNPDVMLEALCLKGTNWLYEHEQRMIQWNEPPGYREFPPECFRGIILGAKIEEPDETFVRGLVANRPELGLFRAEIDPEEFKLNIVNA
jgi:hypothetical protein